MKRTLLALALAVVVLVACGACREFPNPKTAKSTARGAVITMAYAARATHDVCLSEVQYLSRLGEGAKALRLGQDCERALRVAVPGIKALAQAVDLDDTSGAACKVVEIVTALDNARACLTAADVIVVPDSYAEGLRMAREVAAFLKPMCQPADIL